MCDMPAQARLPVAISHSSTPKAKTSAALDRLPSVSSSGGMCVTCDGASVIWRQFEVSKSDLRKHESSHRLQAYYFHEALQGAAPLTVP